MSVTNSWVAGQEAVVAFHSFCLAQQWVFVEIPGQSDFGKDGYVDIVEPGGTISGSCFAVQIKGGRSHRRSAGFIIEGSDSNRRQWAASTMPVIGIAHDPDSGWLHWVDLTELLNREGHDARLFVPKEQHLNGGPEVRRFSKYIDSLAFRQSTLFNLFGGDHETQRAGVRAAYRIGRSDGRTLVLLRRVMFSLDEPVLREAVWALASAGPHPDLMGSWVSQVEPAAESALRVTMQWTSAEIAALLRLVGEDGFQRGSFGQHVHELLIRDPEHRESMRTVAVDAANEGDDDVAAWALLLSVGWAGEHGASQWNELIERSPALEQCWVAPQVRAQLDEWGYVTLG